MYSITAKRMISGLVLKYLNAAGLVIPNDDATALPASTLVLLTSPPRSYETARPGSRWLRLTMPPSPYKPVSHSESALVVKKVACREKF